MPKTPAKGAYISIQACSSGSFYIDTTHCSSLINCIREICSHADEKEFDLIISGFRWMDLLSDTKPSVKESLLDTLAAHLQSKISFRTGERDLVMLQHKFVIEWADGKTVSFLLDAIFRRWLNLRAGNAHFHTGAVWRSQGLLGHGAVRRCDLWYRDATSPGWPPSVHDSWRTRALLRSHL